MTIPVIQILAGLTDFALLLFTVFGWAFVPWGVWVPGVFVSVLFWWWSARRFPQRSE